jgi:putative ABC transport system substrate-binding protein
MRRLAFLFLTVATVLAAWQPASAQHTDALRQLVFVHPSEPVEVMNETGPTYAVIFEELRRLGWQEGRNLLVHRRSGEGRTDQYNNLAREVVQLKPDVIQANGRRLLVQLQAETSSVPIVGMTNDPVAAGLAASLSRPGGNITGVSIDAGLEIMDKYFEILRELLPMP